MSRTYKKAKDRTQEYWSRPRSSKQPREPGSITKRITNRRARHDAKRILKGIP